MSRLQLTSDGYKSYLAAVDQAFNEHVDYAMLIKVYGASEDDRCYHPAFAEVASEKCNRAFLITTTFLQSSSSGKA